MGTGARCSTERMPTTPAATSAVAPMAMTGRTDIGTAWHHRRRDLAAFRAAVPRHAACARARPCDVGCSVSWCCSRSRSPERVEGGRRISLPRTLTRTTQGCVPHPRLPMARHATTDDSSRSAAPRARTAPLPPLPIAIMATGPARAERAARPVPRRSTPQVAPPGSTSSCLAAAGTTIRAAATALRRRRRSALPFPRRAPGSRRAWWASAAERSTRVSGRSVVYASSLSRRVPHLRFPRATISDVEAIIALLADDVLGATRQSTGSEAEARYRTAFREN